MATRDNQTMQAIVIVLTLLVIGLGAGLLAVNNAKKTAQDQAASNKKNADEARQAERKAQSEANSYKQWTGFSETDNFDSLNKAFDEDMKRFGETFDEDQRFYHTILEYISEENRKIALSEIAAKQQVSELKARLLAVEAQKETQVQEAQDSASKAMQDLASERERFNRDRAKINAEKDEIANQRDQQRTQFDSQAAELEAQIQKMETKMADVDHANQVLRDGRIEPDPIAQPADGRITWVNQRFGKVWIDLGTADQLRPQITFSVFRSDESDPVAAVKKGSVEVTRVIEAHMSEARITKDDPTQPLQPGDKLYSQVWDRGRKVGFAITGFIDINDDGKSDLEQLKTIVTINNGRVDSVLETSGEVEGKMTVHTRYLILGDYSNDPLKDTIRTGWDKMSEQADRLGIETITLNEFLNLMGWQPGSRTVPLGNNSRPEDFRARYPDGFKPSSAGTTSNQFRDRVQGPAY